MSAHPAAAIDAIAWQLAAALDRYEADSATMVERWPELEQYREVSSQIETIRLYCSSIADLRVQWVELLIAHAELIHSLWRVQYGNQPDAQAQIDSLRGHHADCVHALRQRCHRVITWSQQKQH